MDLLLLLALAATPATHWLDPTPQMVAWGYYDSAAKPVLRVNSGDTVIVRTLITSTPDQRPAAPLLRQHRRRATSGNGAVDSAPPWIHAGNLDNKELTAGTILSIPVQQSMRVDLAVLRPPDPAEVIRLASIARNA